MLSVFNLLHTTLPSLFNLGLQCERHCTEQEALAPPAGLETQEPADWQGQQASTLAKISHFPMDIRSYRRGVHCMR